MKEFVLEMYKRYYSGKENAITREEFMLTHSGARVFKLGITDRQFRQIYSQLPICTCSNGGFYPIRPEEILEYRDYLRKKAIPLFERFRRVCDAHSGLIDDAKQLDLFEEKIPGMMTFKENIKRWEKEVNEYIDQVKKLKGATNDR